MYYKLYIDSVFILQMTSNLYLLSLAGQILKCTATHKRIWMGAAVGAAMICIVIAAPVGTVGIRILVSAIPVSMCMLWVAFGIRHGKKLIYASLVLAGCGFFFRQHNDMDSESLKNGSDRQCEPLNNAHDRIPVIPYSFQADCDDTAQEG